MLPVIGKLIETIFRNRIQSKVKETQNQYILYSWTLNLPLTSLIINRR